MQQLTEKYRPRSWDEVIAQPKAVAMLRDFQARGILSGRAYWLAGKSGTGKTTLALIVANLLADEHNIHEYNGRRMSQDDLREIERDQYMLPMGGKQGRVYIVNESHGMRKDIIGSFLDLLENLRPYTTVIFTTTKEGEKDLFGDHYDTSPLLSRCTIVPMSGTKLADAFTDRAMQIADAENLGGRDRAYVLKLVNNSKSNFRAVIQAIESGQLCAELAGV